MALFDDKRFLLSHIRHSFITGDDTGICEAVMLHEILPHRNKNDDYDLLEELMIETKSELENAQSLDIVSNMDIFGPHRRRSNTAQRLERLSLEKKNKAKIKVIQWKDLNECQSMIREEEIDDYFPIKNLDELKLDKEKYLKKKSLLSKQMLKYPTAPVNPFNEYSKFDARISETNGNSKRFKIYLTMLNEEERKKPLFVEVVSGAKIQDLIGLICWQFTNNQEKGRESILKPNVSNYCLRIAEENGDEGWEVDPDFPCLNPNDPTSKFGFPTLALEERNLDENSTVIKVNIGQVFTTIEVPNLDVSMNYILDAVIKKRKDTLNLDQKYVLKLLNSEDSIDLNTKLSDIREKEFRLVLLDENEIDDKNKNSNEIPDFEKIEAPLYKCFNVISYQKYSKIPAKVQLEINVKKVDVTYSNPNNKQTANKFWKVFQTKPTSFNVENIIDCYIVDKKPDNLAEDRSIFKINYMNDSNEQSLKFESDTDTANKIINKLNNLMQMYSTSSHSIKNSDLKTEWLKIKK